MDIFYTPNRDASAFQNWWTFGETSPPLFWEIILQFFLFMTETPIGPVSNLQWIFSDWKWPSPPFRSFWIIWIQTEKTEIDLQSFIKQACKPQSYASLKLRPTDWVTDSEVKCRATSVAKSMQHSILLNNIKTSECESLKQGAVGGSQPITPWF